MIENPATLARGVWGGRGGEEDRGCNGNVKFSSAFKRNIETRVHNLLPCLALIMSHFTRTAFLCFLSVVDPSMKAVIQFMFAVFMAVFKQIGAELSLNASCQIEQFVHDEAVYCSAC